MRTIKFPRGGSRKTTRAWIAGLSALAIFGSVGALAQATLPLPTPGSAPAPAAAPNDAAAKARAAALAAKANVDVTEAWTRATNNSATNAPIYLHIVSAKDPDRLLGVDAAMAKNVELRDDSTQAAHVMPNPALEIPGGATINLGPGGRYLSLVGLKAPLKEGDSFIITLKFDKAGSESTAVKILGPAASGPPAFGTARRGDTTAGVSQR